MQLTKHQQLAQNSLLSPMPTPSWHALQILHKLKTGNDEHAYGHKASTIYLDEDDLCALALFCYALIHQHLHQAWQHGVVETFAPLL